MGMPSSYNMVDSDMGCGSVVYSNFEVEGVHSTRSALSVNAHDRDRNSTMSNGIFGGGGLPNNNTHRDGSSLEDCHDKSASEKHNFSSKLPDCT